MTSSSRLLLVYTVHIHNNKFHLSSPENLHALSAIFTENELSVYKNSGFNYVYFHLISFLLFTSSV